MHVMYIQWFILFEFRKEDEKIKTICEVYASAEISFEDNIFISK